jgi:hypothetical protein
MTINLFNLCQHFSYLFIPIFQYVGIGWLNPFNLCQHVKKNRYKKVIRNVGIGWLLYKHDWSCIESVYHHWCCEFQSRSRGGVQHYVIKFVSELRQVSGFLGILRFPPPIKLTTTYKVSNHKFTNQSLEH